MEEKRRKNEDLIDIIAGMRAMKEFEKNPITYSLDEVEKELGLEEADLKKAWYNLPGNLERKRYVYSKCLDELIKYAQYYSPIFDSDPEYQALIQNLKSKVDRLDQKLEEHYSKLKME